MTKLVYHPAVDFGSFGLLIEEIELEECKIKDCYKGSSKVVWKFGETKSFEFMDNKFRSLGQTKIYKKKECFNTIEECLTELESNRTKLLEKLELRKQTYNEGLVDLLALIKAEKEEAKAEIRNCNKISASLSRLDIQHILIKRGLLTED